jgi:hypothetical protein
MDKANFHTNAAALIVAAAQKSGLLADVAEALCIVSKHPNPSFGCAACDILDKLADEFDEHVCTAGIVVENRYGGIPQVTDDEVAAFLGIPNDAAQPTNEQEG